MPRIGTSAINTAVGAVIVHSHISSFHARSKINKTPSDLRQTMAMLFATQNNSLARYLQYTTETDDLSDLQPDHLAADGLGL